MLFFAIIKVVGIIVIPLTIEEGVRIFTKSIKRTLNKNKIALILIAILVLFIFIDRRILGNGSSSFILLKSINTIRELLLHYLGYLLSFLMDYYLIFVIVLLILPFRKIKLGGAKSKPDFSFHSWFTMVFSTGMGIGIVFWSVAEPVLHYAEPMNSMTPFSSESYDFSFSKVFLHWGLHVWAVYSIVGMCLAFAVFNRRKHMLISSTLEPLFGKYARGIFGSIIDGFTIFITITGVSTSLGFGAMQVSSGIEKLTNNMVEHNDSLIMFIIVIISIMSTVSVASGLKKGIKLLSNITGVLSILLIIYVMFSNLNVLSLKEFFTILGRYLSGVIGASSKAALTSNTLFLHDWTYFYWAWWLSWAPFVGAFLARISRGRTIAEFVLVTVVLPTLFVFVWMYVFGSSAIHLEHVHELVASIRLSTSNALFKFYSLEYIHSAIISFVSIFIIVIFFVTSSDSASYIITIFKFKVIKPAVGDRVFWSLLVGLFALMLYYIGGLKILQQFSVLSGIPFAILLFFMTIALFKELIVYKKQS